MENRLVVARGQGGGGRGCGLGKATEGVFVVAVLLCILMHQCQYPGCAIVLEFCKMSYGGKVDMGT